MRRFITKTSVFIVALPIIYVVIYFSFDLFFNSKNANNTLFIWGDSQTYQGIDLNVLSLKTDKKIYTAAKHGAGVYDFLVFADKVPSDSDVLVAISKPAQVRRKEMDNNRSGISLFALKSLLNNNYSRKEIFQIIKKNRRPTKLFLSETNMYKYSDSITFSEPISLFENFYKTVPHYLNDKQNLYIEGVRKLKSKNCRINLIDFPYHDLLNEIENNSPIKNKTDKFFEQIRTEAKSTRIDSLSLKNRKQVMYDLTHLNGYGAKQVSEFIGEMIGKPERTTICVVSANKRL
ncbi:MAG: hypothetical protein NXI20_13750 [bacterium]|nr:hypothetical protein [bacterium]